MKLYAIKAWGNYGGGVVIVRAKDEQAAREYAGKWRGGSSSWNVRYEKPDETEELTLIGEGVIYNFETGE
jgi:hypothetical protein